MVGGIIKKGGGGGNAPSPDTPSAKPKWTGHADAEGLKAIGWTDEDIAYYQQYGVNWNEEDDEWHKVTEDNKALYGVLTASNISTYKDRIVYLPKIDTSEVTSGNRIFYQCSKMIALPALDTSKIENVTNMFAECTELVCVPPLNTSSVTYGSRMFYNCYNLKYIPPLSFPNVDEDLPLQEMFNGCNAIEEIIIESFGRYKLTFVNMFAYCYSLCSITLNFENEVNSMPQAFVNCYSLSNCSTLDLAGATGSSELLDSFSNTYCLKSIKLKNLNNNLNLSSAKVFSKNSLLYLINNEAATSAITIKLASYAYTRLATDPDIVAALANHPNISLAK